MCNDEKQIFNTGTKNINIWWVDDCFTESSPDITGGSFPFSNIPEWEESDLRKAPDVNPRVFWYLRTLAREQDVSFYCVSFKYADAHWDELDKPNALVLLDIGYHGQGNEGDIYGVRLWHRHTGRRKAAAKIRFLTGDPSRVDRYCTDNRVDPDDRPQALRKQDGINLRDVNEANIAWILGDLIENQPKVLGELTCEQWLQLRNAMKTAEKDFLKANGMGAKKRWVHHLPCGGNESCPATLRDKCIAILRRACLHPVNNLPLNPVDFCWEGSSEKWRFPPTRALTQDDYWGRDLSEFFTHLENSIAGICPDRVKVTMTQSDYRFKHDYLWFNVVALGEALRKLAEGFVGKCKYLECRGELQWSISELDGRDDNVTGLQIVVEQRLHAESFGTKTGNSRSRPVSVPRVCFVPLEKATGIVRTAYKFFSNAGAKVEASGDDSCCWSIVVEARETYDGIWAVSCGRDGVS